MTVYFILIFCLIILTYFCENKWSLVAAIVLLLLIGGFRDVSVGTDSKNYLSLFESYGADIGSLYHANEPLYMAIQLFSAITGLGYGGMQFISMLVMLVGLGFVLYRWSANPVYSVLAYVLLYFYFNSFNTMRQYMAVPFVLLSYYYLSISNIKKYLLCIFIATMFHFTALISLVVWPLSMMRIKKDPLILLLMMSFVIGMTPLAQWITQLLSQHFSAFSFYATDSQEYRSSLFSLSRLLLNIYTLFLLTWLREKDNMLLILVIGVGMLNLFSFQPVIGRLAQYFTIIQIIIIPSLPSLVIKKKNNQALVLGSLAYMCLTWLYLISSNVGEVVPWKYGGLL